MTKQEKIQEAYGEVYERYSEFINENGWIKKLSLIPSFEVCEIDFNGKFQRPKTLFNLESNNGWIKIECEDSFPKEDIECYVINQIGRIQFAEFEVENQRFYVDNLRMYPSHYQRIIKPNYPLY